MTRDLHIHGLNVQKRAQGMVVAHKAIITVANNAHGGDSIYVYTLI